MHARKRHGCQGHVGRSTYSTYVRAVDGVTWLAVDGVTWLNAAQGDEPGEG
ncbi:hypothetical protein ACIQVC_34105 [Streptomyces sp. NPDC101112]|jgi:hypothetical protein|uniref:hypothetical protein n=1 Tax=Streptomyces sp. NPDC101112 TaxID=3366105 RepID=UPI0038276153